MSVQVDPMAASVVAAALSGSYPTLLPQWCLPPREAPLVGVQAHQDSAAPVDQPLDLSAKPKNSQVRMVPSGVGRWSGIFLFPVFLFLFIVFDLLPSIIRVAHIQQPSVHIVRP